MNKFVSTLAHPGLWSVALLVVAGLVWAKQGEDFFIKSDLRGQRLMDAGEPAAASEVFQDSSRRGAAFYRAGEFKAAAEHFRISEDGDSQFNYANSLVMQGQYDDAIKIYDRLLQRQPDRSDAITNRKIAVGRAERIKDEGGQMTDGKLGADEIVYDSSPSKNPEAQEVQDSGVSDEAMRGLWLRQVQTTPGDFLRAKFAYQNAVRSSSAEANTDD